MDQWTLKDKSKAFSDGWGIFQRESGFIHIEALDDPEEVCSEYGVSSLRTFEGEYRDFKASAHVFERAAEESELHLRAIAIMQNHNEGIFEGRFPRSQ